MKVASTSLRKPRSQKIVLGTEHGHGRRTALQDLIDAVGRGPAKRQLDSISREERLQCLDRRVMAAGLVAYMHRDIGKILRGADGRTGWNKDDAARRDRVTLAPDGPKLCQAALFTVQHAQLTDASRPCS